MPQNKTADRSFETTVLPFVLHKTPTPEAVLTEALQRTSRVLIIDWKLPERNLDYLLYLPLVFFKRCFGSQNNFINFRRFMRAGGVEGLAQRVNLNLGSETRKQLVIVKRSFLRFGSVVRLELEVTSVFSCSKSCKKMARPTERL